MTAIHTITMAAEATLTSISVLLSSEVIDNENIVLTILPNSEY